MKKSIDLLKMGISVILRDGKGVELCGAFKSDCELGKPLELTWLGAYYPQTEITSVYTRKGVLYLKTKNAKYFVEFVEVTSVAFKKVHHEMYYQLLEKRGIPRGLVDYVEERYGPGSSRPSGDVSGFSDEEIAEYKRRSAASVQSFATLLMKTEVRG